MGELNDRIASTLDEIKQSLVNLADQALTAIEAKVNDLKADVDRLKAENAADPANPENSGETQS